MKIYPVNLYYTNYNNKSVKTSFAKAGFNRNQPNFCSKYRSAKFLGGLFGTIATVSAATFAVVSTGGVAAIPFVLGYGAIGAGAGAALGYQIDKGAKEFDEKQKKDKESENKLHIQA